MQYFLCAFPGIADLGKIQDVFAQDGKEAKRYKNIIHLEYNSGGRVVDLTWMKEIEVDKPIEGVKKVETRSYEK
ncbi:MAG: hypothetical protein JW982_02060 [Spirochaetes bacterium]|nr:hypothetical protein [Spirochaetota bacterium]